MVKLMVGSTVLITNLAYASNELRFYEANGRNDAIRSMQMFFGYFRTLDDEQKRKYNGSINFAVERLNAGETVNWYENNASGSVTVLYVENLTAGHCKTMIIQAIAHGVERRMTARGCIPFED